MTRAILFLLSAAPGIALAQAAKTGYVSANAQGCQVWQPPQLHAPDFIPRYTGACEDGMASGKGHLEWINKFASMRVSATWDGYFHDGVYAGSKPFDHKIEPQERSNEYLVHLGSVAGGDVIVFAGNTRDGELDLCGANMLGVSLNPKTPSTDDAVVKQAMIDAAHSLGEYCPTTPHPGVQVNAYAEPFKIDAHGTRTAEIADARLDWSTHQLSSYSNRASAAVQNQQRQSARTAKLGDERKRFDDFTRHNGITAWVNTTQLDTNPFKYEGKTVGIVVQLDRMVTRDTALVDGDSDGGGTPVQLHGITPDFPDHSHAVLLAVKVGKREPLAGEKNTDPAFTSVVKLDSILCSRQDCDDLLEWQRGADRIQWGDPYTPAK